MQMKIGFAAIVALAFGANALGLTWTDTSAGVIWSYTVSNGEVTITSASTSASGGVIIPSLINGDPVTSIGNDAFYNCRGLTAVRMPNSVTSIGDRAFYGCLDLTSMRLSSSVTNIGHSAFAYCSFLEYLNIPDGVTNIRDKTFYWCNNLSSVTIPNGVTSIGDNAFNTCNSLKSLTIPDGVTSIGVSAFYNCYALESVTIPNSVMRIGREAFEKCDKLKYDIITIPGVRLLAGWVIWYESSLSGQLDLTGCRGIADAAFKNCSRLSSVVIPDGVTSIGADTFYGCSGLTSVTIPDSVKNIGADAFKGCSSWTETRINVSDMAQWTTNSINFSLQGARHLFTNDVEITTPVITDSVTSIGNWAFYNCRGLTSVTIPDSVTDIGNRAFFGCDGLSSMTIGNGVTSIGDWAFSDCTGLASVTMGVGVTSIGEYAFRNCSGLMSVTIPDSVTNIGSYAFENCSGLSSVATGNGVRNIRNYVFRNCTGLTSVTIGPNVTNIESRAFWYCSGIMSYFVVDNNWFFSSRNGLILSKDETILIWGVNGDVAIPASVTSIRDKAFWNCNGLTSVTIPDNVTSIGSYAFSDCTGLASVTMGDGVTSIGDYAFRNCSGLMSATIPQYVCSTSISTVFPSAYSTISSIVISDGVSTISSDTFSGCNGLTSVTMPYNVTSIGNAAFTDCSNLTSVTIPQVVCSSRLSSVFPSAYQSITNAIIADGVTEIGSYAFQNCEGLSSMTIPGSVTSIWDAAFSGCSGLTSVTIPGSVTSIGNSAFSGCSSLTSVAIPYRVTSIGDDAFRNCSGLMSVTIPYGVMSIGIRAFSGCSGLTSVTIPDSVTSIGSYAFQNCSGLTSVTIPGSVASIRDSTFEGCSALTSVTIPDSVTIIGRSAFKGCSGLTSVTIPNSVTNIGYSAFSGCGGITSVTIPYSVTSIGDYAFSSCGGITSFSVDEHNPCYSSVNGLLLSRDGKTLISGINGDVVIPSSVTNIVVGAFFGCGGLMSLSVDENNLCFSSSNGLLLSRDGKSLVSGVNGDVIIPNSVTSIRNSAFSGCSGLTSVTIPNSVTNIGESAFSSCSGLMSVTIPNSVTSIGDRAFSYCSSLTSMTIANGVTSIGSRAFSGCIGLTSVTIPNSVTNIGGSLFDGCKNLLTVCLPSRFSGNSSILYGRPSSCDIVYYTPVDFIVDSPLGVANPPCGTNSLWGTTLCSISSPVYDEDNPVVRYNCIGWTGTGSVPASGTGTDITLTVTEDSSLTWHWSTNVWIECALNVEGELSVTNGWFVKDGDAFAIRLATDIASCSYAVSGDADGIVIDKAAGIVSIPADRPRTLSVTIAIGSFAVATGGKDFDLVDDAESPWFAIADNSAMDGFSLRSGAIGKSETSSTEASLAGPGTISFKWRVPAGRGDYARFYLDGDLRGSIQRVSTWQSATFEIPAGNHLARWTYERGSGNASGDDAAYLDDVDWRPEVALSVSSAFGEATPAIGTHSFVYGDGVEVSVAEPSAVNGSRIACAGWTGTGSVPTSGTGTNATFRIEGDSSIVWNWRTNYWTEVSVTGGTCDFAPQWVADGEAVAVEISPAFHLHAISLSGDTEGATLDGTTLRFTADRPRSIAVNVEEVKVSLSVASAYGIPSPTNGVHALSWGTDVIASVVTSEAVGGVQYACAGWTGTGSVPASGTGTNVTFQIEGDSSLTWNWRTNVWVSLALDGPVAADFTEAWVEKGSNVVVTLSPSAPYYILALSGETDGVVLDGLTLTIPADRPRTVSVLCEEITLAGSLDAPGLAWTTDGDAEWFPQVAVSSDGVDAAKSGGVIGSEFSGLETAVSGAGVFSWSWRLDAASGGNCGVDVLLDDVWLDSYEPDAEWASEILEIEDEGEHTIRFEFWNAGTAEHIADCAYLDCVSWTPAEMGVGDVAIPGEWLANEAAPILAEHDGNYEAAAKADAANGVNKVWECYVAGISPTNATAQFTATITMDENGNPKIEWNPDLNENGTKNERVYTILGRANLNEGDWTPVTDANRDEMHFFKVKVEMP